MTPEIPVLHDEWTIQWNGDPKMGGGFWVHTIGATWSTEEEARNAAERAGLLKLHHDARIVHRVASDWEPVT
jgi:hypothetical protein